MTQPTILKPVQTGREPGAVKSEKQTCSEFIKGLRAPIFRGSMFEAGKFYKHPDLIDLYFKVIANLYDKPDEIALRISWYYLRNDTPLGVYEYVFVPRRTVKDYRECNFKG